MIVETFQGLSLKSLHDHEFQAEDVIIRVHGVLRGLRVHLRRGRRVCLPPKGSFTALANSPSFLRAPPLMFTPGRSPVPGLSSSIPATFAMCCWCTVSG